MSNSNNYDAIVIGGGTQRPGQRGLSCQIRFEDTRSRTPPPRGGGPRSQKNSSRALSSRRSLTPSA